MTFAASVTATTGALTGSAGAGFLSGAGSALGGSAAAGAGSGIMGSLGGMFGGMDLAGMGGLLSGGSSLLGAFGGGGGPTSSTQSVGPFKSSSGLGSTKFNGFKNTTTLDPRFLQAQNQFLGQSGANVGQLGAFSNNPFQGSQPFDLQGITQDQFNLLEELQQPSRDQASQGLEERLFAQGRLGSTGGTQQQSSLQDQFRLQQAQNMQSAFGQGLAGQQQQFGQDVSANQQRIAQQQLLGNLGTGLFGASLSPEEMLLRQHQTAGSFAPVTTESDGGGGGFF